MLVPASQPPATHTDTKLSLGTANDTGRCTAISTTRDSAICGAAPPIQLRLCPAAIHRHAKISQLPPKIFSLLRYWAPRFIDPRDVNPPPDDSSRPPTTSCRTHISASQRNTAANGRAGAPEFALRVLRAEWRCQRCQWLAAADDAADTPRHVAHRVQRQPPDAIAREEGSCEERAARRPAIARWNARRAYTHPFLL